MPRFTVHLKETGPEEHHLLPEKILRLVCPGLWGLCPILDLCGLNCYIRTYKFKMLTIKMIVSQTQSEDWFVTIDLKDAKFYIEILRQHRKSLRFAFGFKAFQYLVVPFGLALSPSTYTKCMDAGTAVSCTR